MFRAVIRAFILSVAQLGDRRILAILAKSVLLTLAIFAAAGAAVGWALLGRLTAGTATLVGLATAVLAGWLLFTAVGIGVVQLFADQVVRAVEAKHYPAALADARRVPAAEQALAGLGSGVRLIVVNLVLAPVYLALLVTGVGSAALLLAVNGWLLGRDLGDMAARRHLPRAAMRDWRRTTRGPRFVLGVAAAALFVVPILGLLAPVLGAAMATHLFHRRGE